METRTFGDRNAETVSDLQEFHRKAIVVDCHTDVILELYGELNMFGQRENFRSLSERGTRGHVDIPRLKEGGVDCQVFAIWSDPMRTYNATLRSLELIAHLFTELDENSSAIRLATTFSEIESSVKDGRIAALLSLEGGEPLFGKASLLKIFYKLGVRLIGPTWSYRNQLAFGNRENPKLGLTESGYEVVREAERLGVILDVSHLNEQSFYDLAGEAKKPFIASHSNSKVLHDHSRNLDDEQIKLIADGGGVIGLNFNPPFLAREQASVDTVCEHAMRMVKLVGSEHVGLGSDYDGIKSTPVGLEDVSKLQNLTRKLFAAGLSSRDVENVLGGSFMRVFKETLR